MSVLSTGLRAIADAIGRGKDVFVLAKTVPSDGITKPFVLAVGSPRVLRVNGGYRIALGLSREQAEMLRTLCDEALAEDNFA